MIWLLSGTNYTQIKFFIHDAYIPYVDYMYAGTQPALPPALPPEVEMALFLFLFSILGLCFLAGYGVRWLIIEPRRPKTGTHQVTDGNTGTREGSAANHTGST